MTPERILLGALALAVAYLAYEVRCIVFDDAEDREEWQRAMADWRVDGFSERFQRSFS
jgi:hypothetical protein